CAPRHPACAHLVPYTTLFRSPRGRVLRLAGLRAEQPGDPRQPRPRLIDSPVEGGGDRLAGVAPHPDEGLGWHERQTGSVSPDLGDRKSTRLNSSHVKISYAVF